MNVDFRRDDWGTVGPRRAQKSASGQGGWQVFHTCTPAADCINPAVYNAIRAMATRHGLAGHAALA